MDFDPAITRFTDPGLFPVGSRPWIPLVHTGTPFPPRLPGLPPPLPPHQFRPWPKDRLWPIRWPLDPLPVTGPAIPPAPAPLPVDPTLVLKAYAQALRSWFTPEEDLSRARQAIFIANPMQYGIPSGDEREEYVNEAIYGVSNPLQGPDSPAYSRGGAGFFEWLQSYMMNVKDDVIRGADLTVAQVAALEAAEEEARKKYEEAEELVQQEYEKMFEAFVRTHAVDSSLTFQGWIDGVTGDAYRYAIKESTRRREDIEAFHTTGRSNVNKARETMDAAIARAELKPGLNMPCTMRDLDPSTASTSTEVLPPAGIIYRPLHYLSGYNKLSKEWWKEYPEKSKNPQKIKLDLENASAIKWKELGFPHLDPASPVKGRAPAVEVWLQCTGMQSFDVFRGVWSDENFRTSLQPLIKEAPDEFKLPVFKTIKVLVAYDVDVVVKVAPEVLENAPKVEENGKPKVQLPEEVVEALVGLVGTLPLTVRANGELHARGESDNAYPALLAVLAQAV